MSGDVDSYLSYSAVVKNVRVAVEISLIAKSVPNCHPLPVLVSAMLKILQTKICRRHRLSPLARAFQRAIMCKKFQVFPEIVGRFNNVRIKLLFSLFG